MCSPVQLQAEARQTLHEYASHESQEEEKKGMGEMEANWSTCRLHALRHWKELTRKLCSNFEHRLVMAIKNNPKAFWRYAKSRLHTRQKLGCLVRSDGSIAQTDQAKSEELNNSQGSRQTVSTHTRGHRGHRGNSEEKVGRIEPEQVSRTRQLSSPVTEGTGRWTGARSP